MFIYGSDFFVLKPGLALIGIGLLLTLGLSLGDIDVGLMTLSLQWQFLGVAILTVGCQAFFLGCISQVLFDYTGRHTNRWLRVFPYTRTTLVAAGLVIVGVALAMPLVVTYARNDWRLDRANSIENHLAVTGLAAVIVGAALFVSTLVLHGAAVATKHTRAVRNEPSVGTAHGIGRTPELVVPAGNHVRHEPGRTQ